MRTSSRTEKLWVATSTFRRSALSCASTSITFTMLARLQGAIEAEREDALVIPEAGAKIDLDGSPPGLESCPASVAEMGTHGRRWERRQGRPDARPLMAGVLGESPGGGGARQSGRPWPARKSRPEGSQRLRRQGRPEAVAQRCAAPLTPEEWPRRLRAAAGRAPSPHSPRLGWSSRNWSVCGLRRCPVRARAMAARAWPGS